MWKSEPLKGEEAYFELSWDQLVTVGEVHLTWNDDVNEDLINLHHHRTHEKKPTALLVLS